MLFSNITVHTQWQLFLYFHLWLREAEADLEGLAMESISDQSKCRVHVLWTSSVLFLVITSLACYKHRHRINITVSLIDWLFVVEK